MSKCLSDRGRGSVGKGRRGGESKWKLQANPLMVDRGQLNDGQLNDGQLKRLVGG